MIIDVKQSLDKSLLKADLCIVGSGPAAISIALSLQASGLSILMIAGGSWKETAINQDLNRGVTDERFPHEPLEENRRRQLGGATAAWGGRCIPYDPIDFEERPWTGSSGWPITYEALAAYYPAAAALCHIGNPVFRIPQTTGMQEGGIIPGFDSDVFTSAAIERWSPPVNFAREYKQQLESGTQLRVLVDTHVLSLQMDEASVISAVNLARGEERFAVTASQYVLAAGGIENPRLLLNSSNRFFPDGIGNQYDNVGRYYMAHLNGTFIRVNPDNRKAVSMDFQRDGKVYLRQRWWIDPAYQKQQQLLNTIFFLHHDEDSDGHRDVLFSSIFLAKGMLSLFRQKSIKASRHTFSKLAPALKQHATNVVRNGLSSLPRMLKLAGKRLGRYRLPYILPAMDSKYWGLYFQAEQVPNRESRVMLDDHEVDRFGMRRATAKIRFSNTDIESVVKAHNLFAERFRAVVKGEIIYSEDGLRQYLARKINSFNSAAHHVGTTRMARSPEDGVVDPDSKVHGINNLYIAGSSVFSTGSHANPTLTIVAQALMLADHLQQKMNSSTTL